MPLEIVVCGEYKGDLYQIAKILNSWQLSSANRIQGVLRSHYCNAGRC